MLLMLLLIESPFCDFIRLIIYVLLISLFLNLFTPIETREDAGRRRGASEARPDAGSEHVWWSGGRNACPSI